MKKLTSITFASMLFSCALSQAAIINFTGADVDSATVDNGILGALTTPADGATVTALTYTVSGLTIDTDGVANDTIMVTVGISTSAGNITYGAANDELGHNGSTIGNGDNITFGTITISGMSSGGLAYNLDSALYTSVTNTRWNPASDITTFAGSDNATTSAITSNTAITVALNDAFFTQARVSNGFGIGSINFALDVSAIPEPTSTALLGLGGLALLTRRGRK